MTEKTIHEGRNVKRIREMLGIKQDALAFDLGLSQQAISQLEQKEALDKDMLEKIAADIMARMCCKFSFCTIILF